MKTFKMNWFEYWIGHCWMTGWQSIKMTFWIWRDLMTDNYSGYGLLKNDDPYTECYDWFWTSINEDDTYSKEFLEYLYQLADDVETGKVEPVPFDYSMLDRLDDLVKDMELNDESD